MQNFIRQYKENLPEFICTMKIKGAPTQYLPRALAVRYERYKAYQNDRRFMMLDCDIPTIDAHKKFDIEPNFIIYNPKSLHFQAYWALLHPVHCQMASKLRAPYRYLRAIESAYDEKYGGDIGFGRYIHRNPLYSGIDTDWRHTKAYKLAELAEVVELADHRRSSSASSPIVTYTDPKTGRIYKNTTLFHDVRTWAYANACNHTDYDPLFKAILTRISALNSWVDQEPLRPAECACMARSIADFIFYKYKKTGDRVITDEFRRQQAKRGAIGGKKSKGGGRPSIDEKLIAEIQSLKTVHNYSNYKIAKELGISKHTVSKYAK